MNRNTPKRDLSQYQVAILSIISETEPSFKDDVTKGLLELKFQGKTPAALTLATVQLERLGLIKRSYVSFDGVKSRYVVYMRTTLGTKKVQDYLDFADKVKIEFSAQTLS